MLYKGICNILHTNGAFSGVLQQVIGVACRVGNVGDEKIGVIDSVAVCLQNGQPLRNMLHAGRTYIMYDGDSVLPEQLPFPLFLRLKHAELCDILIQNSKGGFPRDNYC